MRKLNLKIRSEEGAASVLEAIIVYPIVFVVVVLLLILGLTYVQEGYLTYQSQQLSEYLAKSITYPGYPNIEKPKYTNSDGTISIGDINEAMKANAPYRYMFGIFSDDAGIKDNNNENLAAKYVNYMAYDYLKNNGFLKASSGKIDFFDAFDERENSLDNNNDGSIVSIRKGPKYLKENGGDGYLCAINATTSKVDVYMAQNFVFSRFFNIISLGNRKMYVKATGMTAVSDSLEIVKTTDMVTDMVTFLGKKLGFDTSKFKTLKEIIQGNK